MAEFCILFYGNQKDVINDKFITKFAGGFSFYAQSKKNQHNLVQKMFTSVRFGASKFDYTVHARK
jgi:hypothetical protein